jgi:hypothetical protein
MAETERASSLLAGIFTGEDTSSFTALNDSATSQASRDERPGVAGLDEAHTSFLMRLAERANWPRSEVNSIAAELGLMPDGALAIVNEAAWDIAQGPAFEGTDPVVVDGDVVKEML